MRSLAIHCVIDSRHLRGHLPADRRRAKGLIVDVASSRQRRYDWGMGDPRALLIATLALAAMTAAACAEDWNDKFGPSWNCSSIDPREPADEINQCQACAAKGQDFNVYGAVNNPLYGESCQSPAQCTYECWPKPKTDLERQEVKLRDRLREKFGPPSTTSSNWAAIATALDSLPNGGQDVSAAYSGSQLTKQAAEAKALEACRVHGQSCKVVSSFQGCGFVAITEHGSKIMAWGVGSTPWEATAECQTKPGAVCKQVVGGCQNGAKY